MPQTNITQPGKLNEFQKAVEQLALSMGLRGSAQQGVYSTPQYQNLVDSYYGAFQVPPGAQVLSRTASQVEYVDPEGYTHRLTRDLDGRSPTLGMIQEASNRPSILPSPTQQQETDLMSQLLSQLSQQFQQPVSAPDISGYQQKIDQLVQQLSQAPSLQSLDPQTMAALDAIKAVENAKLQQQFQQGQGNLIASLYGKGVNQSSIANQAAGLLLQNQGLVQQQTQSDQAQRQIALQQFLSQLQQGNRSLAGQDLLSAANLALQGYTAGQSAQQDRLSQVIQQLNNLTGQRTQRDIAGGQIDLGQRQLDTQKEQFRFTLPLEYDQLRTQFQIAQMQNEGPSKFERILGGLGSVGASLIPAVGSIFRTPKTFP